MALDKPPPSDDLVSTSEMWDPHWAATTEALCRDHHAISFFLERLRDCGQITEQELTVAKTVFQEQLERSPIPVRRLPEDCPRGAYPDLLYEPSKTTFRVVRAALKAMLQNLTENRRGAALQHLLHEGNLLSATGALLVMEALNNAAARSSLDTPH